MHKCWLSVTRGGEEVQHAVNIGMHEKWAKYVFSTDMKSVHEAVHAVRSLTVKLQSQSVEAALVDQSVYLPSTPDRT